jgi:putative membrane protein
VEDDRIDEVVAERRAQRTQMWCARRLLRLRSAVDRAGSFDLSAVPCGFAAALPATPASRGKRRKELLMKSRGIVAALVVLCCVAVGAAQARTATSSDENLSVQDAKFLKTSAQGALFEVLGGQTAMTNAARQDVKDFGQRMVTDHSREYQDAQQTAASVGIHVPNEPMPEQQKVLQLGSQLHGPIFDCFYISNEWNDHQADIAEAELEIAEGQNVQVIAFAHRWLRVYKMHADMASQILLSLNGCGSSSS